MAALTFLLGLLLLLLLLSDQVPVLAWKTLSGRAPTVIAHGGNSGLYPDQTLPAYMSALNYSSRGVVLSCDLQIAQSSITPINGTPICRTNLNLKNSTAIAQTNPELNNTYTVDGVPTLGWYAIDISYETLTTQPQATQSVVSRSNAFDRLYNIFKPELIPAAGDPATGVPPGILSTAPPGSNWWLNSEYTTFIEANSDFNASQTTIELVRQYAPGYVSAPEISLVRRIRAAHNTTRTTVIYKFRDVDIGSQFDTSTNETYASLLRNLTYVRTFCSGILVPKSYIWPVDEADSYLKEPTNLVQRAHAARLLVYVYNFANDEYVYSYNFTYDPVIELLYFIDNKYNFSVDGVFTDYPITASEAISCYASSSVNKSSQVRAAESIAEKPTVISHNGNSGQFPGSTTAAYQSAIAIGVDYIDCVVQITSDSIPICRPTINLIQTTNIVTSPLGVDYLTTFPDLEGSTTGVFTFQLTLAQIQTLRAIAYNPDQRIHRDPSYDNEFNILTLADFLEIAKNHSVGAFISIQNAVFLRYNQSLAVVDAVVATLSKAEYNSSSKVMIQSDDSSSLTRLRTLGVTYPLMYQTVWTEENPVSLDESDFVQIKEIASSVSLASKLVEPISTVELAFLTVPPIDLVAAAHAQNLTVYFQEQTNEPTVFAFDYQSDPTLQLNSLAKSGFDGIITDFPATVRNYLNSHCSPYELRTSTINFSIPTVVPGALHETLIDLQVSFPPVGAPAPNLVVPEAPLTAVPVKAPAEPPVPAAASHLSTCFLVLVLAVAIQLVALL